MLFSVFDSDMPVIKVPFGIHDDDDDDGTVSR